MCGAGKVRRTALACATPNSKDGSQAESQARPAPMLRRQLAYFCKYFYKNIKNMSAGPAIGGIGGILGAKTGKKPRMHLFSFLCRQLFIPQIENQKFAHNKNLYAVFGVFVARPKLSQ